MPGSMRPRRTSKLSCAQPGTISMRFPRDGRLFGLKGLAPLAALVRLSERLEPGRVRGRAPLIV